jgi:hypothetical protein
MKKSSFLIYLIALSSFVIGQNRGGYFEIYTHTAGQSGSVQFWMEADGAVWDQDHSTSQTHQNLICS